MDIYGEYLQLARLAISGRKADVLMTLRRTHKRANDRPEFNKKLKELLSEIESRTEPQRRLSTANMLDRTPSTAEFTKDYSPSMELTPIWPSRITESLESVIAEQQHEERLRAANIEPTKSLLFTGPPGVGKTLAAEWLAQKLGRELMVLDLASVMSSYLGKTGANISQVLKSAAEKNAVLLLDEFDSIAKRRDDDGDVGELKRLVNVLLQALDVWNGNAILIAATNHPELLDRAVWRRFDHVIEFPMPSTHDLKNFSRTMLHASGITLSDEILTVASIVLEGLSYAEAKRWFTKHIRSSVISNHDIEDLIVEESREALATKSLESRVRIARLLIDAGFSQRRASEISAVSRDTIRKNSQKKLREIIS